MRFWQLRVLVQRGLQSGMGMSTSGGTGGAHRLARFIESLAEKGLEVSDLAVRIRDPIVFQPEGFVKPAYGYEATVLPEICDAVLEADKRGLLLTGQKHYAEQCGILVRALAKVGIIALVDEATGYQDMRARDALAKLLEAFVSKELKKWVRTFPVEYFKELCRLRGIPFPQPKFQLPSYFGHLTNDIVYDRLAPFVREELHRLTPRDHRGRLKHKLFQRLTDDVGHPKLREHLASAVALMKAADDYQTFEKMLNRALPKWSKQPLLAELERVNSSES